MIALTMLSADSTSSSPATWRRWPLRWPSLQHWSLYRRFMVVSMLVVIGGELITAAWMGHQIETSVVERVGGLTALYVDSVISPNLQGLAEDDRSLDTSDQTALDRLVSSTGLSQGVVLFKVWTLDGRVVYAPDRELVGQHFPIDHGLARASVGEVAAEFSDLLEEENASARRRYPRLVEVYAPVHAQSDGRVIAVNEFYILPDQLDATVRTAQMQSWALVAVVGLVSYLLLLGMIKQGSDMIDRQQVELRRNLEENVRLHDRLRRAASRTTALNEQALRRISADLHDGPGQELALALLRLDELQIPFVETSSGPAAARDFVTVRSAVHTALEELRTIAAHLRTPALERLSVTEIARRTITDHERQSRLPVAVCVEDITQPAPLPTKIALLRTLQEALSNATRHAGGRGLAVALHWRDDSLQLVVSDQGPGFQLDSVTHSAGLGLPRMRGRAELLGGSFDVHSAPGSGTTVQASWPLLPQ